MALAASSAARAADWMSPSRPYSFIQTPGLSLSSVSSTRTPAHFSMASSTTMAGDQPPISIRARASVRRHPVFRVHAALRKPVAPPCPYRSPWRAAPPGPAPARRSRSGRELPSDDTPFFEFMQHFENQLLHLVRTDL